MGVNTHPNYISFRGGGTSLTSSNSVCCHCEGATHVDMSDVFGRTYACHCEERSDVAIARSINNNEIPERVRDDEYSYANKIKHVIVPLALRYDVNNAITTSDLRSPRNDEKTFPRPLGRGIKGEGLSHSKKAAFTLAEVLITLAIIGIVAAMTIPTLVANYQNKAWNTSASVFERKLEEALKTMNTQQVLAGYSNTAEFVSELGKYFKITKVCANDDIMSCFEDKVFWGAENEEVDMTKIKNAKNFGQEDWDTETIGVQFANGTTGLIAYNPECKEQPFTNQFNGTSCLAILYDTTGFKTPNTQLKDLRSINVLSLGSSCAIELSDGTCFTAPFKFDPITYNDCMTVKEDLGIKDCYNNPYSISYTDNWAGAVKACGGVDKLPSQAQLAALAEEIYETSINASAESVSGLNWNKEKVESMGFDTSAGYFYIPSRDEVDAENAYKRYFNSTYTYWKNYPRRDGSTVNYALCIGD